VALDDDDQPYTVAVLVISDDDRFRRCAEAAFAAHGFSTVLQSNAEDAIHHIRVDWAPDVLVVDLLLPRLDLIRAVRALRSTHGVPIVIVADRGVPEAVALPGTSAVIEKAETVAELAGLIEAVSELAAWGGPSVATSSLSRDESALLARLASEPGEVVQRAELMAALRGLSSDDDPRLIDVHLIRLLVKLDGASTWRINQSPTNGGFALVAPEMT
jgi:DNA-binding response OmpR family regulator